MGVGFWEGRTRGGYKSPFERVWTGRVLRGGGGGGGGDDGQTLKKLRTARIQNCPSNDKILSSKRRIAYLETRKASLLSHLMSSGFTCSSRF